VRAIHGAGLHREIDIWYSNLYTPTLTCFKTPIQYGEVTEFIETLGSSLRRIAVTPRTVPTPGEEPEPQVIASINEIVGTQQVRTMVVAGSGSGSGRCRERRGRLEAPARVCMSSDRPARPATAGACRSAQERRSRAKSRYGSV
jgi:hypothetical protein